jgi:hypothetical protein
LVANEEFRPVGHQISLWNLPYINPILAFGACALERLLQPFDLDTTCKKVSDNLEENDIAE